MFNPEQLLGQLMGDAMSGTTSNKILWVINSGLEVILLVQLVLMKKLCVNMYRNKNLKISE